ncbi:iron complex outermembrane recepter protein [Tenacibaculum mesophilum]|uniref:TonB-dependent siderophore receptor n=1 Tax=Tenacibaculum mesophilum TaxID=104268 RepID=A0ABM7CH75_9FLAO|nr:MULTISPECIES: TonB-dependent receptor [Tenacibaculum]AZJ33148.1 TonB-dependent siderophore receptor [Tenacibaculum mesophilum]QFS28398.1 TonB-dependent siderophore receptor [Tenacibaculum mesophilum]SHF66515.1 iron complex outermembrane recepter protein [Tenacibaculum mesophilum]
MKGLLTTILLFLVMVNTVAQEGNISGTVLDNNNEPLVGVNIIVKGTKNGVQTDIDGNFTLSNTKGETTLIVSYVGFKTKNISTNSGTKNLVITLYEGNEILNEVTIDTHRKNKFSRKKTAYVAKLPLKNIENAQVYSTVTNQLLVSQSVTSFEEALKNTTGVEKLWSSTGRGGDGAGFYSIRGFSVQPQLVNGVPGITNGFINPDNVERIEVVKGPSATLYGSTVTSYGGLINIVTKKPYKGTGGNITVGGGSFGFKKLTVDLNTNLEDNENISLRLNAGYQTQDSFQDAGFRKALFLAPSVSYKVNNRLTLNFNYELSSTDQTNQAFLFLNRSAPLTYKNLEELNYDRNKSFTNNDISIKNPTQNYRGEIAYKITDNWSSQTIIAGGNAKSKGYYTYLYNVQNDLFGTYAIKSDAETNTLTLQQNFTGDFKLGSLRNRLVIGVDYLDSQVLDNSTDPKGINVVNPQGQLIPVPPAFGFPNLPTTRANIDTVLANSSRANSDINQNILSGYISDVINILPELSVMAGVRYDRFNYKGDANDPSDDEKEYTKSTFSPKFGIVYQPILDQLSVFANYQNGFSYVNPERVPVDIANPDGDSKLQSYDLEQANQLEFGIKTNLFNNKLETTLSYYDITVKDKVMGFGANKQQDATVKSKGFELEMNANPVDGLNLRGGISYNDAKVTKSKSRPDLVDKRLAEAGPETSYNFWADYKFQEGAIKNVGLGFGLNGASKYNTMVGYPAAGDFYLPAYTIFNASIYYEVDKFRISVKGNNLANEEYYTGWSTITPQNPRAFLGTISYKF